MRTHLKHHTAAAPLPGESTDATLDLRDALMRVGPGTVPPQSDFARPAEDSYTCMDDVHVCLHWNQKDYSGAPNCGALPTGQQALPADQNCWLDQVQQVIEHVASTYKQSGYRSPKPDGGIEDASIQADVAHRTYTDIYLANTGAQGKYGYCSVDASAGPTGVQLTNPPVPPAGDVPAFCVLDDDFADFGARSTPVQALEVTVAHEFFHATQFAYDFFDDRWFMEATAVWMEDQMYTDINDNLQYLPYSQLRTPRLSLDDDQGNGGFLHYGDWIFIRYLTEHIPATTGSLPNLVLQMWQDADSLGPDMYSAQAIVAAVQSRGYDFNKLFAQYADALHHPATGWSEGAANHYPTSPLSGRLTLRPNRRGASGSVKVDHLASATVKVTPQRLSSPRFKLRVGVQMAPRRLGSGAVVSVFYRNGTIGTRTMRLSARGRGQTVAAFSSKKVRFVEVTLANAGHRYKCWTRTAYSCMGTPRDDHRTERFSVSVIR